MTTASPATSADGFHATHTAQRADELVRALFEAVNADDSDGTDGARAADFTAHDFFRIDEDGRIAEHWETVDWVPLNQSFGMLPDDVRDL